MSDNVVFHSLAFHFNQTARHVVHSFDAEARRNHSCLTLGLSGGLYCKTFNCLTLSTHETPKCLSFNPC